MSEAIVIEVWGESVALALQVKGGFKFVAAAPYLSGLDGKLYPTFGHARLAAIQQQKSACGAAYLPVHDIGDVEPLPWKPSGGQLRSNRRADAG